MTAQKTLRKFPKAGTIGNMVLTALAGNKDLKTEDISKKILKKFPESKFNSAHLAWYKHQVRVGNYILPTGTSAPKAKKTRKSRKSTAVVDTPQAPPKGVEVPVTANEEAGVQIPVTVG